jgi:hypothetical protein
MSYFDMDHAGWVRAAKKRELTPFQARVMNICGIVGGGIYNAPIAWETVDWSYGGRGVSLIWKSSMATFDFPQLTWLVLLCHDARIRVEISSAAPRMLRLSFWQRADTGSVSQRHPSIEDALADVRELIPSTHSILYRNHVPKESADGEPA